MAHKIAILFAAFVVFTLVTWGFDVEGGRYLQQAGLVLAGFVFANILNTIAEGE
jgi:hypothetical protein